LTKWRGFDDEEDTEEPIYEKWIDTPRMLKEHLHELAQKGDELAIKGLEQIAEWENNPNDDPPGTTGETYPVRDSYASRVVHL
jgi:hypothetical protein